MEMIFRPLDQWQGALTEDRTASRFEASYQESKDLLVSEAEKLDTERLYLLMPLSESQILVDGSAPYANARPEHPGVVAVLEGTRYGDLRYATDQFKRRHYRSTKGVGGSGWQSNLRAIALGLQALRKVDRYAITKSGQQYRGFLRALEAGTGESTHMTASEAEEFIRDLARKSGKVTDHWSTSTSDLLMAARWAAHPDHNDGDHDLWNRFTAAAEVLTKAGWGPKVSPAMEDL